MSQWGLTVTSHLAGVPQGEEHSPAVQAKTDQQRCVRQAKTIHYLCHQQLRKEE